MRGTNLETAYKCNPNFFKVIEHVCCDNFWLAQYVSEECVEHWKNEHEVVTSNIVNDWFQNFEESNKEMTNDYNESMHELSAWRNKKEKLDRINKARQECEVGFQDCIEYTNPTIREAFKSRGFVDGTWNN